MSPVDESDDVDGVVPVDANAVVSAVAAVIALAALGLTIQQTRMTRAHNRLSVQPVLDFGETYRQGERAGLQLRNVGLGPAQILSGDKTRPRLPPPPRLFRQISDNAINGDLDKRTT